MPFLRPGFLRVLALSSTSLTIILYVSDFLIIETQPTQISLDDSASQYRHLVLWQWGHFMLSPVVEHVRFYYKVVSCKGLYSDYYKLFSYYFGFYLPFSCTFRDNVV